MADTALTARSPKLPPHPIGLDKAAILLLTLGADAAASVLKHLSEGEVRQISAAMVRMRTITRPEAAAVHEEAWRWLTSRAGYLIDGESFVRKLITAVAPSRPSHEQEAMRDLTRGSTETGPSLASQLELMAPQAIARVIGTEHPQVIAFIVANLGARQAAEVLGLLPEELHADIVHRIAELKSVAPELLAEVGTLLAGQVQSLGGAAVSTGRTLGGTKLAADIMNLVDKGVESRVFSDLDDSAPEVAETIRNLMLTFEDLIRLDNRGLQLLLKEVAREDLMLALKTASPAMQEKVFANISARAAEILQEDMSTMGPVRLKDVEKAQANIITVARRLAEEQKIQLGGGGDDALV
ncbi:MAG TPA: flagellar motor switch protein FliG [Candidatus Binatia bacterium]|nr:flagellar motor switch protein FliG [Candidatus Binatia bacterium]